LSILIQSIGGNMSARAAGTFEVKSWEEKPLAEIDGKRKLTQASVTQAFSGDLVGDGAVEWLMSYREDGTADFVGLQRIVGRVGGRSGSFVLQTTGTFDGQEARGDWQVVRGSGTGDLAELRGEGEYAAPRGPKATYSLDYDFET
jgi:hypothetical protein